MSVHFPVCPKCFCFSLGQIKKITGFRVTRPRPCLNLLVKPKIVFRFSGEKNRILCILKGEMPFKMHKFMYFFQKHTYFIFGLIILKSKRWKCVQFCILIDIDKMYICNDTLYTKWRNIELFHEDIDTEKIIF